jgi:hypothetical protein
MKDLVKTLNCFGFKMYLTIYGQSSNILCETIGLEPDTITSSRLVIFVFTIYGTDGHCNRDQTVVVTHVGVGKIG